MVSLNGRHMFIWKLAPVLATELTIEHVVEKAKAANLRSLWIKIAEGSTPYQNVVGQTANKFHELRDKLAKAGIDVWGWQVPHGTTQDIARKEAQIAADLAKAFSLQGVIMDAESGNQYFQGGAAEAEVYASTLRKLLDADGRGLALCGHDIPTNFPSYPFTSFARHASFNAPQVYYGGSPSVENRLSRAINANAIIDLPFIPVGAAWVGDAGGCASASACAERAREFIRQVGEHGFPGYSFWHWYGCPPAAWQALFEAPAPAPALV